MHEAIGEDIAESSCFLMVTLHFRRVNSTIVWRYSRPYNKLPRGGARKRGEPKQGTIPTGSPRCSGQAGQAVSGSYKSTARNGCATWKKDGQKSRTGGPG